MDYQDRGFIDGWDFDENDFIADSTWRELDVSHIVPEGARLVFITVAFQATEAGKRMIITQDKDNGSGNANHWRIHTQVAGQCCWGNGCIMCTADGKIGYYLYSGTYSTIHFSVRGWLV